MVHALREAWRVLIPQGILIDQRPQSIESPLEIVYKEKSERAGMLDMRPGLIHDVAADQSIGSLVADGIFREIYTEQFQIAYYWDTVRGMVGDFRERWQDDVRVDRELIQTAYQLFGMHHSKRRVRLVLTMKLTSFKKVDN
jgi:hypothetical protein